MPPSPPQIPMDTGDLALVLAGYKTVHYTQIADAPPTGIVMLVDADDPSLYFPVHITQSERVPNHAMGSEERVETGRHIQDRHRRNRHAGFYPSYLFPEPAVTQTHYQRAQMQLLTPKDIGGSSSQERMTNLRDYLHHYERAAILLEPRMRQAHRYVFQLGNHVSRANRGKPIHARPPTRAEYAALYGINESMNKAMPYMRNERKTGGREALRQRLHLPAGAFRQALKHDFTDNPRHHKSTTHSIETHARFMEMAAYTRIAVPPGNAAMVGMGTAPYIARIDNSNMEPFLGFHDEDTQGIVLLDATEPAAAHRKHADRSFMLPVAINLEDGMNLFNSELTNSIAQMAGHPDVTAMRKALGIRDGQNPRIHLCRARALQPHEIEHHDLDKAQSIFHDWMNAVGKAWRESKDPSIRASHRLFDTLPKSAQALGLHAIATPEELVTSPKAIPNRNATGPLPAILQRAWRSSIEAPIKRVARAKKNPIIPTRSETLRISASDEFESVEFQPRLIDPESILDGSEPDPVILGVPIETKQSWRQRMDRHTATPFRGEEVAGLSEEEIAKLNADRLANMRAHELRAYSEEWARHGAAPLPRHADVKRNGEGELVRGDHEGPRKKRKDHRTERRNWRNAWSPQQVDPQDPFDYRVPNDSDKGR